MYFSSDFERSNCWYYLGNIDVFWNARVLTKVLFLCFFGNVEGRNEVRGKSKELKTVEILVWNEELWYPIFFRDYQLFDKYENWWIPRSIWLDPRNEIGDFQDRPTEAMTVIGVPLLGARGPLWG